MKSRPRQTPRRFSSEDNEGSMAVKGKNLVFSGEVSNKLLVFVAENLAAFGTERRKAEPRLILNSFGGDVYSMNAVVDFLEFHGNVCTIATGSCMSAAVPIIASGKKGKRFATRRTRFMLHAGHVDYDIPLYLDYIKSEIAELEELEDVYARIMARTTGKHDVGWWAKHMNTDPCWYFSADEAVDLGIIDAVIEAAPPEPRRNTKSKKKAKKKTKKKTGKRSR